MTSAVSTPITVLLNSHFDIVPAIRRESTLEEQFRFIFVVRARSRGARLFRSDIDVELAEAPASGAQYAAFIKTVVDTHNVDVILPGRKIYDLARYRSRLERSGARLITAGTPSQLAIVGDKGFCYDALRDVPGLCPRYIRVETPTALRRAITTLIADGPVCFKPARSIFGVGFRVLPHATIPRSLRSRTVSIADAYQQASRSTFRPQVVMEYLPGIERSVDCLAEGGRLISAIVRQKRRRGCQYLEANARIERMTESVCQRLGLTGLFNVQFRNDRFGRPRLLEINGRMAGGITKSFGTGVVLPLWAIRMAMGRASASELPLPQLGMDVRLDPIRSAAD